MSHDWNDKEGKVEWLESERLIDDFFVVDRLRLKHEMFNGGMTVPIRRFLLQRPDAVCAVVVNTDRDIMYFVRQFRIGPAAKGDRPWMTELAAGVIDEGETAQHAILREIREELGFAADQAEQILKFYPSSAIISERIFLFYVEVTDNQRISAGGGIDAEHEDLEIVEVPLEEVGEFVEKSDMTDAKTLIGLQWYLAAKDGA